MYMSLPSYDQILVEGLPDWKQPVYYYRRARRMSIYELSLLVLVVATIAQVLIGWAQYFEKWLVLVSSLGTVTLSCFLICFSCVIHIIASSLQLLQITIIMFITMSKNF